MREELMITRQGRRYVLYAGLLDEAHNRGLRSIDTELVQAPSEENGRVAIAIAKVELEDGRTFTGIGDASPDNVGRNIVPHIIRMSETRAKARALRDAINVGMTALEEIADEGEQGEGGDEHQALLVDIERLLAKLPETDRKPTEVFAFANQGIEQASKAKKKLEWMLRKHEHERKASEL